MRAVVPLEFPGNHFNSTGIGFSDSPVKLLWTDSMNVVVGACGNIGARIQVDQAEAWIQRSFSCSGAAAGEVYNLNITVCDDVSDCEKTFDQTVDLTQGTVASAVCPPPPEKNDCDDCGCQASGGAGGGAASPSGGGASGGGPSTGPGTFWFYKAGGIGRPNQPGSADWDHGRYWSHSYAQRIFIDPDDSDVAHLITERAVYRTYTDDNSDGTYDRVDPASDYRTLIDLSSSGGSGWTLTDLDGTVTTFRGDGRWLSTADRYGNTKTSTYTGTELTSVTMPDGRREDFTYLNGKVRTITEVGVDGTTSRAWTYTWTGEDLTRVDRPDGTALIYTYGVASLPGYLSRITLEGMDGTSERITAAFDYDGQGNVIRMWRGSTDFAMGVDPWQFAFDNPVVPKVTTLTDPLGNSFTRTWEDRDFVTDKARLSSVDGDCPTCGLGPNSQLVYGDSANPFRPTQETDGNGNVTLMSYDAQGRTTSRTEAFGDPEERTTTWSYDPSYPELVDQIERPSTSGNAMDMRVMDFMRDSQGNPITETQAGVEGGLVFSYDTVRTFTPEGKLETMDPPGHSADDLVTYQYDPTRGGLVLDLRIDPIVGTTDFGHDPFNRQTSVIDPNGVETVTEYDPLNRVTFVRRKGAVIADDLVTENRYNTFGDLFQTVLPEGNVIEYTYDAAGRLESIERKPDDQPTSHGERVVYTLDDFGNRVLEQHQRWESGAWVTRSQSSYSYGTRCYLDSVTTGLSGEESTTEYAYDCNGNLERIWDANHPSNGQMNPPSTIYGYDPLDRLVEVRQPFGGPAGGDVITAYQYDVQDHLIQVTDGEGTVTTYQYSDRDLLTQEISEVSGTTVHTYTDFGQPATKTDARGIVETRTYDDLDRLLSVDYADDTLDIAYTYDDPSVPFSIGRLTRIARDGHGIDYRYDRFGRVTQDGELTMNYDKNGNRTTLGYPEGIVATYGFDYADRESGLTVDLGDGSGPQSVASSVTYLPSGPLDALTLGNGFTETRAYDSRYYPSSIILNDGMSDVLSWTYTTDAVGNPTTIVDDLDAANNRTYGYQDYQYFLTQGDGPWGTLAWTYDKIGNRLTESRDGATADSYVYVPNQAGNNSPRLDRIDLGIGGIHQFAYDAIGDQTQADLAGNVIDRSYDQAGRMSRQERAAAQASTDFLYDGRGFLRRSTGRQPADPAASIFCDGFESGDTSGWSGGGSTCFDAFRTEPVYSSAGTLHHTGESALFYLGGRPIAQLSDGLRFLTTDHLRTPILLSGTSTDWSGGFEPFGLDYTGSLESQVFLRFPGQWDSESWKQSSQGDQIFYNANRWYLSNLDRYSRPDPLGYLRERSASGVLSEQGLGLNINPYVYSSARPTTITDSLGLKCESGCVDCPGGFWTGLGAKVDVMLAIGIGVGGNIGLVRMTCTSSDLACDLVIFCGKAIGAGGSAGVTASGSVVGNTKCREGLTSVTVGVDIDGGSGLYSSGGVQASPGRTLKETGFGAQIEVGIGGGLSGGLSVCKPILQGCK